MSTLSPLRHQNLKRLAAESLRTNIVQTLEGKALRAGAHQFSSLWTRDFCFSVPGLMAIGESAVARSHLGMLLKSVRPDGSVPRILDEGASSFRVVRWTLGRKILPGHTPGRHISKPLRREYLGEHKTLAYDSGALVFLAAAQLTGDWSENEAASLKKIIAFYERMTEGFQKPLVQPAYSDWQDSARREGSIDFVHYLILRMLWQAHAWGWVETEKLQACERMFYGEFSAGVLKPEECLHGVRRGERQISLEAHLFRIQDHVARGELRRAEELWRKLKDHPIYHRALIPGVPVDPESKAEEISFFTRSVGLKHYHDRLCWTWLAAETAKTAVMVGETTEAERIFATLESVVENLGDVPEVLEAKDLRPFESLFYASERPFSWGAAKICEAMAVWEKSYLKTQ